MTEASSRPAGAPCGAAGASGCPGDSTTGCAGSVNWKHAPRWSDGRTDFGSVLFEDGDTTEALEQLQRAIRLDPEDARAHEYLGLALWASNRRGDAEVHLRRAAELSGRPWPPPEPWEPAKPGSRAVRTTREPASGGFRPRRRRARSPGRAPRRTARIGGSP